MDIVPFHFDAFGGFGEVQGLAHITEQGLELQFTTRDALFGVLKTGQRSVQVPLSSLMSVRYRAGWFWLMPKIELRVRDLATLKDLPESEQGRVTLSIKFGDRHDAKAFAGDLEMMRSRLRILQLDGDIARLAAQQSTPAPLQATVESSRTKGSAAPPLQQEE